MRFLPLFLLFILEPVCGYSQKLHAFIFCNTNDAKISEGAKVNFFNIVTLSEQISKALNMKLIPYYLFGEGFEKGRVEETINEARFNPGDIVLLYINSHGANVKEENAKFPVVAVNDVFMSSFGIYKKLASKKPKTLISVIEACNGYKKINSAQIRFLYRQSLDGGEKSFTMKPITVRNIQTLFNGPCRFIVCSGPAGMDTWSTNNGSIFTNSLLRSFNEGVLSEANTPTWLSILKASHTYTFAETEWTPLPHYPVWSIPKCDILISQSIDDDSVNIFEERPAVIKLLQITSTDLHKKSIWGKKRFRDYSISLKNSENVDSVTYFLHHSFNDSIVTSYNKSTGFAYHLTDVYGGFPIKAWIYYNDGTRREYFDEIVFIMNGSLKNKDENEL